MPIVALTADVAPKRRARYEQAGFTDHIAKPIDTDGLLSFMERYATNLEGAEQPARTDDQDRAAV